MDIHGEVGYGIGVKKRNEVEYGRMKQLNVNVGRKIVAEGVVESDNFKVLSFEFSMSMLMMDGSGNWVDLASRRWKRSVHITGHELATVKASAIPSLCSTNFASFIALRSPSARIIQIQ
jgi:hypothetical protein